MTAHLDGGARASLGKPPLRGREGFPARDSGPPGAVFKMHGHRGAASKRNNFVLILPAMGAAVIRLSGLGRAAVVLGRTAPRLRLPIRPPRCFKHLSRQPRLGSLP